MGAKIAVVFCYNNICFSASLISRSVQSQSTQMYRQIPLFQTVNIEGSSWGEGERGGGGGGGAHVRNAIT